MIITLYILSELSMKLFEKRHQYLKQLRTQQKDIYFQSIRTQLLSNHLNNQPLLSQHQILNILESSEQPMPDFQLIKKSLMDYEMLFEPFRSSLAIVLLQRYRNVSQALYCLSYCVYTTQGIQWLVQQTTIRTYLPLLISYNIDKHNNNNNNNHHHHEYMSQLFIFINFWSQIVSDKSYFEQITPYYDQLMKQHYSNLDWLDLFNILIKNKQLKPHESTIRILLQSSFKEHTFCLVNLQILQQVTNNQISEQLFRLCLRQIKEVISINHSYFHLTEEMTICLLKVMNNIVNNSDKNEDKMSVLLLNEQFSIWILGLTQHPQSQIKMLSTNYLCLLLMNLDLQTIQAITYDNQLLLAILSVIELDTDMPILVLDLDFNMLSVLAFIFMIRPERFEMFYKQGGQQYLYKCCQSRNKRISEAASFMLEIFQDAP